MTSSTHRGRDSLSPFYLRFFQSLPTPQLLPDPSCSSPLLFLLIYLLCAHSLLVRCLLIFFQQIRSSSQRIGCSSSSSSSSSSRTPRTPLSPSNQNHCMLKNEIEGKEAKMERSWYDKGRGPFRPPPPPSPSCSPSRSALRAVLGLHGPKYVWFVGLLKSGMIPASLRCDKAVALGSRWGGLVSAL